MLSNSVAVGLNVYRDPEKTKDKEIRKLFIGSEQTEQLIRLLDETFDILNARCAKTGITEKKWERQSVVRHL